MPCVDRGQAGVGVGSGECERAGADLGEPAAGCRARRIIDDRARDGGAGVAGAGDEMRAAKNELSGAVNGAESSSAVVECRLDDKYRPYFRRWR